MSRSETINNNNMLISSAAEQFFAQFPIRTQLWFFIRPAIQFQRGQLNKSGVVHNEHYQVPTIPLKF